MRPQQSRNVVLVLAAAVGLAGCASSGGGARPEGSTSNRIVQEELMPLGAQLDAYQAIERLRPRWLQPRVGQPAPTLYVDGTRRGGLSDLRSMRLSIVERMEYMSASDATTRFGTGNRGGAIMVFTRR
jgi:hypothetical protein